MAQLLVRMISGIKTLSFRRFEVAFCVVWFKQNNFAIIVHYLNLCACTSWAIKTGQDKSCRIICM